MKLAQNLNIWTHYTYTVHYSVYFIPNKNTSYNLHRKTILKQFCGSYMERSVNQGKKLDPPTRKYKKLASMTTKDVFKIISYQFKRNQGIGSYQVYISMAESRV